MVVIENSLFTFYFKKLFRYLMIEMSVWYIGISCLKSD